MNDNHEVTVDGVTYRRGEKLDAVPVDGRIFYQSDKLYKNTEEGFAAFYPTLNHPGWERVGLTGCHSYYQAIPVEKKPELVELECAFLSWVVKGYPYEAENVLAEAVQRALKADKVVITMPDGSVTTATKHPNFRDGESYWQTRGGIVPPAFLGHTVEQALMAGRRVQIQEVE